MLLIMQGVPQPGKPGIPGKFREFEKASGKPGKVREFDIIWLKSGKFEVIKFFRYLFICEEC